MTHFAETSSCRRDATVPQLPAISHPAPSPHDVTPQHQQNGQDRRHFGKDGKRRDFHPTVGRVGGKHGDVAENPPKSAEGGKKSRENAVDSRVKGPKVGGPIGMDDSPLEGKEAGKELAKIGGNVASEDRV